MFNLKEYEEDKLLFLEMGLIAIKQGDEESAKRLFDVIGLIEPTSSLKKMGYGLIAVHKLDLAEAQNQFKEVIEQEPNNGRALAFLAFTHMLALMNEQSDSKKIERLKTGAELAQKAIDLSTEDSTKQLAQSVLDWEVQLQNLEMH